MDKISKVALLAAAAAGVAAGVLYVAASAASSRPSNAADSEGDDTSAGADSPGQRESERPPAPPRRTRAGAGGAGAGSAVERTRKDSATRKNSWAEPLYAREDGASGLNTKATSVVDDMLRKARDQVDLLQDQAAQLYIPTPRRRSRRHSVTRGPARKPSEATRKAVLQFMSCTSEHGVNWMLGAVADGMDLASAVGTYALMDTEQQQPTAEQARTIDQDIPRTFPDDPEFRTGGAKLVQLRKVLYAVSRSHDGGYTQGMNFIAGHLLRHCQPPLAYALFMYLLTTARVGLDAVYAEGMPGVAAATTQLQQLMTVHFPDMAAHLQRVGFNYHLLMKHYMSMFACALPAGPALDGVWDVIFSFGWQSVLYVVLALAQVVEHHVIAGKFSTRTGAPGSGMIATTDSVADLDLEATCALFESLGKRPTKDGSSDSLTKPVEVPTNLGKRAVKLMMQSQES